MELVSDALALACDNPFVKSVREGEAIAVGLVGLVGAAEEDAVAGGRTLGRLPRGGEGSTGSSFREFDAVRVGLTLTLLFDDVIFGAWDGAAVGTASDLECCRGAVEAATGLD